MASDERTRLLDAYIWTSHFYSFAVGEFRKSAMREWDSTASCDERKLADDAWHECQNAFERLDAYHAAHGIQISN
jgi:hypothetical protein